jgi:hypothetical protein
VTPVGNDEPNDACFVSRYVYLCDVGGADYHLAEVVDAAGEQHYVLARSDRVNVDDASSLLDIYCRGVSHEQAGMLDDATFMKLWGEPHD